MSELLHEQMSEVLHCPNFEKGGWLREVMSKNFQNTKVLPFEKKFLRAKRGKFQKIKVVPLVNQMSELFYEQMSEVFFGHYLP